MPRGFNAGDRVVFVDADDATMDQAVDEVGGLPEEWPLPGDTAEVLTCDEYTGHTEVRLDVVRGPCATWWVLTRQLQHLDDGDGDGP